MFDTLRRLLLNSPGCRPPNAEGASPIGTLPPTGLPVVSMWDRESRDASASSSGKKPPKSAGRHMPCRADEALGSRAKTGMIDAPATSRRVGA